MRTLVAGLLLAGCGGSPPCTDAPLAPCAATEHHNLIGNWSLSASQTGNRCGFEVGLPLVVTRHGSTGALEATSGATKLRGTVDANGTFEFWNESFNVRGTHVQLSLRLDELRGGVTASGCERWQFVGRR